MKILRALLTPLLLASASVYAFQETISWNAPGYTVQFKYLLEKNIHTPASWAGLAPTERAKLLEAVKKPALARLASVQEYYETAIKKWDTAAMDKYTGGAEEKNIKAAAFWLGGEKGRELALKVSTVRALTLKACREGLDEKDTRALAAYLLPGAISDLKAIKLSQSASARSGTGAQKEQGPKSGSGLKLTTFATDPSSLNMDTLDKFYSGRASNGSPVDISGGARQPDRSYQTGADVTSAKTRKTAPDIPLPPLEKSAPPSAKTRALTSDAYGITVFVNGKPGPLTFRSGGEAATAIRRLPDGSVTKVIFYGHGAPGLQTVGDYEVDAEVAARVLKDKMAPGGVVQFTGCNTAGVGTKPSVNPLFGLSIGMRRLLYFSLPYFQERFQGRPAAEAREYWEKTWNSDLARDTSVSMRGSVVCGLRTFGLVPGRFPGVTTLMGNQEATTPGYVAGVRACYLNGSEVPAP